MRCYFGNNGRSGSHYAYSVLSEFVFRSIQSCKQRSDVQLFFAYVLNFSTQEMLFLYSPLILSILQGIIMLVSGFTANRIYYNHCTKKIRLIKSENVSKDELDSRLEKSGGVNLPLAVCVLVVYMIISYLPSFL